MTEFVYNNAKNANINHMLLKLNCKYHFHVLYKKSINFYSKSKIINKLVWKLKNLIKTY